MKIALSLRRVITLAVVVGLLLPALFSSWQTVQQQRAALTAGLESDQQRLATLLATAVAKLSWDYDNKTIQLMLDAAAFDERVVQITVSDNQFNFKAEFHRPERRHGRLLMVTKPLQWQDKVLGQIRLGMDTGQLEASLRQQFERFLVTAAAQVGLSLTLILLILNARFVVPLKRLLQQSGRLARRDLDKPFIWQRSDELGKLGNSLESTRLSLQAAFKDIQESEQRFRSLTNLSSDWYWERDEEDRLTMISPGFKEITGIDPNEVLGSKREDHSHFNYHPDRWGEHQKRVAAREPFHDMEWSVLRSDGEIRYGITSGEPVFDADGAFRGYRGIGKDITAAKLAEAAQKSAARLRQLVEHLPAGAIYIEDGVTLLNQAAEQITGYPRSVIASTTQWFEKMFGEDAKRHRHQYQQDKTDGFPAPREIEIRRKDGARCVIEFAAYSDDRNEVWLLHDITQRKAAQAALEQALLEQRAMFDNATAGIFVTIDRRVQRCNRKFEEMLGYAPGELTGQPTRIYFPSDEAWEAFGKAAYEMINAGGSFVSDAPAIRKDGAIIWHNTHGKAIDPQDPSKGVIWVAQDITARKLAEEGLTQALLEQQAIFDNANAAIHLVKNRIHTRCNRGFEEMLGYQHGELTGKSTRLIYPSDESYETFGHTAYEAINAGENWIGEVELARKDGAVIWCSCHGRALDPQEPSKGSIWVLQDITKRKRAEEALKQALLEQRAMFDNATAAMFVTIDRRVQRCNRKFEEILGYAPGELAGQSTRVYFPSDEAWEAFGSAAYARISAGETFDSDIQAMRKDGALIWCSGQGKAIDPQDPSRGVIWMTLDITARKLAEDALRQALLEQQALLDNSVIGIASINDRIILRSNGGIERILGYQSGEMTGKSTRCWYASDEEYRAIGEEIYSTMRAGKVFFKDLQLMRKDGAKVWCSLNSKAVQPGRPEQGAVSVLQDISARKAAEAALVDAKNRLELGLAEVEQTHREVTLLGELSSFLQACQSAQEAYDSLGSYGPRLFPASAGALYLSDESGELLVQASWGEPAHAAPNFLPGECWALRRGQPYRMDNPESRLCCPHLHANGSRCFPYACLPLVAQGETFGLLFIEHHQSVEEGGKREMRHRLAIALAEQSGLALANIRLRETLRLQSIRDPLTGLYNRRYMNDILRRELARAKRSNNSLAVAIIDVDHFKRFNDTFGHDAGDYVLQNVAKVLEERVRQSDVVCRFGGEEFVVVLPEISCELAEERAGSLLDAVRSLDLQHGSQSLGRITASLGLAFYPLHGLLPDTLIGAADHALYQAKNAGRDCVKISNAREGGDPLQTVNGQSAEQPRL